MTKKTSSNEILSAQEYLRKRADLVEEIIGKRIDITYKGSSANYIEQWDDGNYKITIAKPMVKHISTKCAVYHELSHALHKTFLSGAIDWLTDESRYKAGELAEKYKDNEEQHEQVRRKINSYIFQQYLEAFNILEDQRIESLTAEIWLATKKLFTSTRTKLGKDMEESKTISSDMLAERFNRTDLVKDKELIKAIHDMEGKDEFAPIIVFKKVIKDKIDKQVEGLMDELGDLTKKFQEQEENYSNKSEEAEQLEGQMDSETDTEKRSELSNQVTKKIAEAREIKHDIYTTASEIDELLKDDNLGLKMGSFLNRHPTRDSKERTEQYQEIKNELEEIDNGELEELLQESKENSIDNINEIKDAINGMSAPQEPSNIKKISRGIDEVDINEGITTALTRILRKLKEQQTYSLSDTGEEVDIDGYINAKTSGNGDCFVGAKRSNGISIFVTIDGSGSMSHDDNIGKARSLVASLFKVAKQHEEITVRANVWSSNGYGDVGMTDINTLADCKQITVRAHGDFYETPTHEALLYSARKLKNDRARHKLLILITDGYPQYTKKGYSIPKSTLTKMTKKALRKSLEVVPSMMCINISQSWYGTEILNEIFGKRLVTLGSMDKASEFIQTQVRQTIVRVMR